MIWLTILELAVLFGSLVRGQETCLDFSVGITDRDIIPDSSFTASSFIANVANPFFARLNENRGEGVWCASEPLEDEWLEVDLGRNFVICGIRVQAGFIGYVTKFKMGFSADRGNFTFTREFTRPAAVQREETVFYGINPFRAGRYVRILPTGYVEGICIRLDLFGFPAPKITCNPDFMLVEFDKKNYIDLKGSNMHLINENCVAASENTSHISFRIPLDRCGTQRSTRDDDLLYTNQVIRKIDAADTIVTRQMDLFFPVECFYDRDFAIGGVNYRVETTPGTSPTEGSSESGSSRVFNHSFLWTLGLGLPAVWCLLGVVG